MKATQPRCPVLIQDSQISAQISVETFHTQRPANVASVQQHHVVSLANPVVLVLGNTQQRFNTALSH